MTRDPNPQAAFFSTFNAVALPVVLMFVGGMMAIISILTSTGQELHPPKSLENWSYAIGIGLGVLCLVYGLRQRPATIKLATVVVTTSIVTAAVCSMLTAGILDRVREWIVFRGDHLVSYESDLRVWNASIHHGRYGLNYYITLHDYPVDFRIPESDYLFAFGAIEHMRPNGYCVKVNVQRAGDATRIIADNGISLPAGSLQRCPAWVN